jgi:hypothetical protein
VTRSSLDLVTRDGLGDWTRAHNIAKENPKELAELQRLFLIAANKHHVLPLDDRPRGALQRRPDSAAAANYIESTTPIPAGRLGSRAIVRGNG